MRADFLEPGASSARPLPGITMSENTMSIPSRSISIERRLGIRYPADGVAELFEQAGADRGDVRIVFHQQHRAAAGGGHVFVAVGLHPDDFARQQDRDGGALAEFAFDLTVPPAWCAKPWTWKGRGRCPCRPAWW